MQQQSYRAGRALRTGDHEQLVTNGLESAPASPASPIQKIEPGGTGRGRDAQPGSGTRPSRRRPAPRRERNGSASTWRASGSSPSSKRSVRPSCAIYSEPANALPKSAASSGATEGGPARRLAGSAVNACATQRACAIGRQSPTRRRARARVASNARAATGRQPAGRRTGSRPNLRDAVERIIVLPCPIIVTDSRVAKYRLCQLAFITCDNQAGFPPQRARE